MRSTARLHNSRRPLPFHETAWSEVLPSLDVGVGRRADGWQRSVTAHRFAWENANGPISVGLHVCHTCDNPGCVNVEHLWLGTNAENIADRMVKGRSHRPDFTARMHPNASLTPEVVRLIREDILPDELWASEFGIGIGAVKNAKARRSWKHVE